MKKALKVLLILCLILSVFSVPTLAVSRDVTADGTIVRPMFKYINTMTHYFDINRYGKATCSALLNAFNADELKVVVELQQYDIKNYEWKTIKTWSSTEAGDLCGAGGTWYVMSDNMYRSVATGYVYVNGKVVEEHRMVSSVKVYE
ncbi:hypothetical protein Cst_c26070 [Thermoclostridium stercorarium subsp. stercorarium DSM 8532]|uniref:Uncharacterized protein n=2 Tax=Thermoclostridium stercorarium TaxID=1510 RepID=L7VRZ8_THES1|nr:hypothetical protein [Thermoclostridium stercorarium]AGC69557.1 hypothetical protein Cst_c26070 [Thermoclostridium stercorarium subsp. stercorarium DSM 8532]AGI40509.1 hypothetical protein Clst_2495 [Thermoclostridium stercorarium subsp. stercorarium DSM 8532]ANW99788.1 hypothetical protein CSTERTH_12485 [Thermoclostridium stercorarium subsp. thermolacticum DSM 2910]UZQ85497.1 hypothetical protein ODU73_002650 [Thermoclostridium stercorarium]